MLEEELKTKFTRINFDTQIKTSGIPMGYDEKNMYIDDGETHSLVIGGTGSGKTQSITLPMIYQSILSNESFVINDTKGEILKIVGNQLKENGYNIIVFNQEDRSKGNSYNPLTYGIREYKKGNKEKAIELFTTIGNTFFSTEAGSDEFWKISTTNLFTGIILYLLEHAKEEEINFKSIYNIANSEKIDSLIKGLDINDPIYMQLQGVLKSPYETKQSIISILNMKLSQCISNENIGEQLSYTNFNFEDIVNKKTAFFIINGMISLKNDIASLLLSQLLDLYNRNNNHGRVNFIIDDFDELNPIYNLSRVLDESRSNHVRVIMIIKGVLNLINKYGTHGYDEIKLRIGSIVYLYTNEIETQEEFIKKCGKESNISIQELKLLQIFESVILKDRMNPFKTKLLPYFNIVKNTKEDYELKEREKTQISIYNI